MDRSGQNEILYRLTSLHPSPDARDPSDGWSGITSTVERKKRQNRLNQRKYRSERKVQTQGLQYFPDYTHAAILPVYLNDRAKQGRTIVLNKHKTALFVRQGEATLYDGPILLTYSHRIAHILQLLRNAHEEYGLCTPRPAKLPILIRLNVLGSLGRNATLMGFPPKALCPEYMISPYNEQVPVPSPSSSCPRTLMPTLLQRQIQHHPWIDLFPFPKLRDNMLLATDAGFFNEDDLCMDLLNEEVEDVGTRPALMIWGESCDVWAWEANLLFLQKWG